MSRAVRCPLSASPLAAACCDLHGPGLVRKAVRGRPQPSRGQSPRTAAPSRSFVVRHSANGHSRCRAPEAQRSWSHASTRRLSTRSLQLFSESDPALKRGLRHRCAPPAIESLSPFMDSREKETVMRTILARTMLAGLALVSLTTAATAQATLSVRESAADIALSQPATLKPERTILR